MLEETKNILDIARLVGSMTAANNVVVHIALSHMLERVILELKCHIPERSDFQVLKVNPNEFKVKYVRTDSYMEDNKLTHDYYVCEFVLTGNNERKTHYPLI